ncbi:response regulator transcription factor [Actinophytocola sp. KF-1]
MMPTAARAGSLLLVEDDRVIGRVLSASLRRDGYDVRWHASGAAAVREAATRGFAVAVVDLGLPDMDGIAVCHRVRELQPGCLVVIVTARTDEVDVIVGLESGADDYLTKPVRLGELRARIRAHERRSHAPAGAAEAVRVGGLCVDPLARRVSVGDRTVPLRAKEFDLLARLARSPGTAVSRAALMADVWGTTWQESKTLDVHIAALRRKLGADAPAITTVRGYGYRLEHGPVGEG